MILQLDCKLFKDNILFLIQFINCVALNWQVFNTYFLSKRMNTYFLNSSI